MAMVSTANDLIKAVAVTFSGHDDLFSPKKKVTTATLRKQFKAAVKRVDKAIARYKKALLPLYMPYYEGGMSGRDGKFADVYLTCLNSDGTVREFATELSWTFYRRGRGGKFYEKPQTGNKKHCEVCNGPCYAACPYRHNDELVSQDYLDLCRLEYAICVAVDERERVKHELEAVGVDVYHDAELWQ